MNTNGHKYSNKNEGRYRNSIQRGKRKKAIRPPMVLR